MDLATTFPGRFFISLRAREDRRRSLIPRLRLVGFGNAEWFPAIESEVFKGDSRGYLSPAWRSLALGARMILRTAGRRKHSAIVIFEDDAVFHPAFSQRVTRIVLPDDWGLFYFGCLHLKPPERISADLVRVRQAVDAHAIAIRADRYVQVRKILRGNRKSSRGELRYDVRISELHESVPTYAALPNLAWQSGSYSDLAHNVHCNYDRRGRQLYRAEVLDGVLNGAN